MEISQGTIERFWNYTDKNGPNGCWEWTGCLNDAGYGVLGRGGSKRIIRAHRLAWLIMEGEIPEGMCLCHKCDNRKCVNTSHMFVGTRKDNNLDGRNKGRMSKPPVRLGVDNNKAKLTPDKVRRIRNEYAAGGTSHRKLGRKYGLDHSQIGHIVSGQHWRHIA